MPLDASNSPNTSPNLYSTQLGQSVTAYSTSFTLSTISPLTDTTQNAPTQVAVSLPAFAQGPGLPVHVQFHNTGGLGGTFPGIPATISDGNNASTVSFSVTYNTALLTVTGGVVDPSILGSYPQATFSRTTTGTPVGGIETDTFTFSTGNSATLSTGSSWTLGDITASVPNSPGQQIYKDKQVLTRQQYQQRWRRPWRRRQCQPGRRQWFRGGRLPGRCLGRRQHPAQRRHAGQQRRQSVHAAAVSRPSPRWTRWCSTTPTAPASSMRPRWATSPRWPSAMPSRRSPRLPPAASPPPAAPIRT